MEWHRNPKRLLVLNLLALALLATVAGGDLLPPPNDIGFSRPGHGRYPYFYPKHHPEPYPGFGEPGYGRFKIVRGEPQYSQWSPAGVSHSPHEEEDDFKDFHVVSSTAMVKQGYWSRQCATYRAHICCPVGDRSALAKRNIITDGLACIKDIVAALLRISLAVPPSCCNLPLFNWVCVVLPVGSTTTTTSTPPIPVPPTPDPIQPPNPAQPPPITGPVPGPVPNPGETFPVPPTATPPIIPDGPVISVPRVDVSLQEPTLAKPLGPLQIDENNIFLQMGGPIIRAAYDKMAAGKADNSSQADTCAWTKTIARNEEYECCRNFKGKEALLKRSEEEKRNITKIIEVLSCLKAIGSGLLELRDEFPKQCCKHPFTKPMEQLCELFKNNTAQANAAIKSSFTTYEQRQSIKSQEVCKVEQLDNCCFKEGWKPPRSSDGQVMRIGRAKITRALLKRHRNFFNWEFISHVFMCIQSAALQVAKFNFHIPDVCCSLPIIGRFCKINKPTKKPDNAGQASTTTTTTTTTKPPEGKGNAMKHTGTGALDGGLMEPAASTTRKPKNKKKAKGKKEHRAPE